jgi:endonuclease/exonuclease/phosphatase (EEP) superfamily protein YafD
MGVSGAAVIVAVGFVIGRLDLGFASTLANPWAVQCAVLFVLLAALGIALRRRLTAAAMLCGATWAAAIVLPTLMPRGELREPRSNELPLRVLEANVCNRVKPTAEAVASLRAEKADLVAILELTDRWEECLAPIATDLPHAVIGEQNELGSGVALYSRYPLREARVLVACEGADRQIEAIVEHPAGAIRVFVIHPLSPRSVERTSTRDRELALIAERCEASDMPTLVIGDFNETPYGRPFAEFLDRTGYRGARDAVGFAPTWPAEVDGWMMPEACRIPIDHIVGSAHFVASDFRVGPHVGSDHMPIIADLLFTPPSAAADGRTLIASPLPSARPEDQ